MPTGAIYLEWLKFNGEFDDADCIKLKNWEKFAGDFAQAEQQIGPAMNQTHPYLAPIILLLVAVIFPGCATIAPRSAEPVNTGPSYIVEIEPSFGAKKVFRGQLEEGMTIDSALEASGAKKKLANMEIDLYRMERKLGRPMKMAVNYLPGQKHVSYDQDYALYPGDRIIARSKSSFPLAELPGALNPLPDSLNPLK